MHAVSAAGRLFLVSMTGLNAAGALVFLAISGLSFTLTSDSAAGIAMNAGLALTGVLAAYCAAFFSFAIARSRTVRIELDKGKLVLFGRNAAISLGPDEVAAYYPYNGKIVLRLTRQAGAQECYPYFRLKNDKLRIRTLLFRGSPGIREILREFDEAFDRKTKISLGMLLEMLAG